MALVSLKNSQRQNGSKQTFIPAKQYHGWPVSDVNLPIGGTYLGEPNLKRAHVSVDISEEHKIEFFKCMEDPVYFLETYTTITSVDDGIIPFKLRDYQKDLIELYHNNRFAIALQARQTGKTTTTAGYILWFLLFHEGLEVAVVAHKLGQSIEIMDRIKDMFESLPYWLQNGVVVWNKGSIAFENKCKVSAFAAGPSALRGKSISLLFCDEMAFFNADRQFYESSYSVLSSGSKTRLYMTSTPNGMRGVFYNTWLDAISGKNEYAFKKVLWSDVVGRDEAWKETTIKNGGGIRAFRQEHECEFLGGSDTLIDADLLRDLETKVPIKYEQDSMGEDVLQIYHEYKESNKYIVTVDTAAGVGGDYSVARCIDVSSKPFRTAAIYRSNTINPMLFPTVIHNMGMEYGEAPILVETNNTTGGQVITMLFNDLEYPNLLRTQPDINGRGQNIVEGYTGKLGLATNKATKSSACTNLKLLVENGSIEVTDQWTATELLTFVADKETWNADLDCHDDCVDTLSTFAWLTTQPWFNDYANMNVRDDAEVDEFRNVIPFGIIPNLHNYIADKQFIIKNEHGSDILYKLSGQYDFSQNKIVSVNEANFLEQELFGGTMHLTKQQGGFDDVYF